MKKYILLSITATLIFAGCVKDDQPQLPPPPPSIVINELMAKDTSDVYFIDASGSAADWVELYNKGNNSVDVAGMWITDNPGTETDYQQIPGGEAGVTTIPPKGFLVLICGAADADGVDLPTQISNDTIFIDFGISSSGDNNLAIYDSEKVEVDISDDFNGLTDNKSFGRTFDAGAAWDTLEVKSPGFTNGTGSLVINEFMASNNSWDVPGDNGDQPDWIEIYNTGDTPLDMGGWFVTDDIDAIGDGYQLPTDDPDLTTVPAHGYLVIICDGVGEGLHADFKLSSGGESVGISKDGVTLTDGGSYCDTGCDFPNPGTDNSTGRDGDGAFSWFVYLMGSSREPSPGQPNN